MDVIANFGYSLLAFLVLLTVLVFVHEMGHFLLARRNGVRVEVFSIGFGPEVFGWTDRTGTRWKFSWIPLGGYVKMFGDTDVASAGEADTTAMTDDERAVAFQSKGLGQRTAIVFAGPAINYVFAVVIWAVLFAAAGESFTPAVVSYVEPGSAAAEAGLQTGDRIIDVDGRGIDRFEDVQQTVRMDPGVPIDIVVLRDGRKVTLRATPTPTEIRDRFGNTHRVGVLGVRHYIEPVIGTVQRGSAAEAAGLKPGDVILRAGTKNISHFGELSEIVRDRPGEPLTLVVRRDGKVKTLTATPTPTEIEVDGKNRTVGLLGVSPQSSERLYYGPFGAIWRAVQESIGVTRSTFHAVGQMFTGTRTTEELGGPIKIAQLSGQMAQGGSFSFFWFMAFISLNLCIINLFPVPMLDGGHLLFYAIEAVRGRPLGQRAQEYGFRIGLALVLSLMVFVTWNDLANLKVFDFFKSLIS